MKKEKLIAELKRLGVTEQELEDINYDYNKMRAMYKDLEEANDSAEVVEDVEVGITEEVVEVEKGETDLLFEEQIQLKIHETKIYQLLPNAVRVEVENVGGGDVYLDVTSVNYDSRNVLQPGKIKVYKGAKRIFLATASRPIIRIKQYTK